MLLDFIRNCKFSFRPIHTGIILGVFVVLYQYVATFLDPVLSGWNAQNITKSPGILDLLISFSPMLPIAIYGIWRCWKKSKPFSHEHSIFIIWLLVSLVLVIIPFPLQRRFCWALHTMCDLGVIGLCELLTEKKFNIATPVHFDHDPDQSPASFRGNLCGFYSGARTLYIHKRAVGNGLDLQEYPRGIHYIFFSGDGRFYPCLHREESCLWASF